MPILAPELSAMAGVRHAFFTREGGVSSGVYASLNGGLGSSDDASCVAENRRRMTEHLGLDALVSLHQIHSPDARRRGAALGARSEAPRRRHGDGAAPALRSASPRPIAGRSCSPTRKPGSSARPMRAGAARSVGSWKRRSPPWMASAPGASGSWPCSARPSGRTPTRSGRELVAQFREADRANERFFRAAARDGHALFDLPGFIRARLDAAGVATIADLGLCTYADESRFYSYRRATHRGEPDYGRLISAIALIP